MMLTWMAGFILAGALIWGGLAQRKTPMRATTRQMSVVVGIFILVLMAALAADELFHWWAHFPKAIIGAAGVVLAIERTVRLLRARQQGGVLVLDLGRVPLQDMILNLFAGLALGFLSIMDLISIVHAQHWAFQNISLQVLGLAIAYAVLLQGLSRRGFNERGIFYGTGLLPWEAIDSFHWERESTTASMLVLRRKKGKLLFGVMALSVNAASVTEIEEILRQHAIGHERDFLSETGRGSS